MTTTSPSTLRALIEGFADNVLLDQSAAAELESFCEIQLKLIKSGFITSINQLDIAPGELCTELDVPTGSTWAELLAHVCDEAPAIAGTNHLEHLVATAAAHNIKFACSELVEAE